MQILRNSLVLIASLTLVIGCSSSEFGSSGGDGPSAGAQKAAKEGDKDKDNGTDEQDKDNDNGSEESTKEGDEGKLDEKDDTSASSYEADESTKGCKLPDDVRSKFTAGGLKLGMPEKQEGASLQGWGGSGSANVKLTNLSLTDCTWFEDFKDSDAVYIVQYDEKGTNLTGEEVTQSYAEPFNGKTAAEFALCLTSAAGAGAVCNNVGDIK